MSEERRTRDVSLLPHKSGAIRGVKNLLRSLVTIFDVLVHLPKQSATEVPLFENISIPFFKVNNINQRVGYCRGRIPDSILFSYFVFKLCREWNDNCTNVTECFWRVTDLFSLNKRELQKNMYLMNPPTTKQECFNFDYSMFSFPLFFIHHRYYITNIYEPVARNNHYKAEIV